MANVTLKQFLEARQQMELEIAAAVQLMLDKFRLKCDLTPYNIYVHMQEVTTVGDEQRQFRVESAETKFFFE